MTVIKVMALSAHHHTKTVLVGRGGSGSGCEGRGGFLDDE
jgi:hypothetical protein